MCYSRQVDGFVYCGRLEREEAAFSKRRTKREEAAEAEIHDEAAAKEYLESMPFPLAFRAAMREGRD